jgi:hypothetical protein
MWHTGACNVVDLPKVKMLQLISIKGGDGTVRGWRGSVNSAQPCSRSVYLQAKLRPMSWRHISLPMSAVQKLLRTGLPNPEALKRTCGSRKASKRQTRAECSSDRQCVQERLSVGWRKSTRQHRARIEVRISKGQVGPLRFSIFVLDWSRMVEL